MKLVSAILYFVILFIGITLISFAVIHLAPGNFVDMRQDLSIKMTPEARQKMEALYGLDKPVLQQYQNWFGRLARLDFGESFVDGEKVLTKIMRYLPVTLGINLLALGIIFGAGIWIGVLGAAQEGKWSDRLITFLSLAGFSLPTFWIALILISLFGLRLHWLPVSGLQSLFHEEMPMVAQVPDLIRHLILPLAVATLTGIAGVSRYMRSSLLHVLKQNYIRAARARGLSRRQVLYKHALKNALLPIFTLLGLSVPGLIGGSVIYESIFSIPGMGRLFYQSVFTRDYPVIMGILVIGAAMTLLGNFLADRLYRFADPRLRS